MSGFAATGDPVRATGGPVRATGDPVRATGDPVRATGDPVRATGDPVRIGEPGPERDDRAGTRPGAPSAGAGVAVENAGGAGRSAVRLTRRGIAMLVTGPV